MFPTPFSLIHVHDLVEILLKAADRGDRLEDSMPVADRVGRGYYFACADEHPTYWRLGRMIARGFGFRWILPLYAMQPVNWLVGAVSQIAGGIVGRPNALSIDKLRDATADSWACSPGSVRSSLQFSFPCPLATRIDETARWYLDHGWL
jgi:nucleoside-diphosphate-sugar epimerase